MTVGSGADTLTYRVGTVEVLSRDELARRSADVFSRTGTGRLVLITCGGSFDESSRHYRDNVIVVAEPA